MARLPACLALRPQDLKVPREGSPFEGRLLNRFIALALSVTLILPNRLTLKALVNRDSMVTSAISRARPAVTV